MLNQIYHLIPLILFFILFDFNLAIIVSFKCLCQVFQIIDHSPYQNIIHFFHRLAKYHLLLIINLQILFIIKNYLYLHFKDSILFLPIIFLKANFDLNYLAADFEIVNYLGLESLLVGKFAHFNFIIIYHRLFSLKLN